ncbi:DUF4065 domain-containing protein [Arthrobacter sp. MSA 4-2]|uniref:Panacea domain-containing protein n=1 Tax=Arthrobacter sp. MSA 4-2 TaxID=2794349 RepID=UPI0018E818B1|nr:type II toxin-antitoxin system antitoxin SocA domain-containing protein [Arthrobacter sp. MSA 4-2]MBJ2120637.1 DUF4065 domain-containing protein [Arthrobacter sp. MSA 4-2]
MANVHDVAAYIVSRLGNMSTMKLQKLCYYSQGWHLAWEGGPLFSSKIEAWRLGPVVRDLYSFHRRRISVQDWPPGDPEGLTEIEKSVVDDVLDAYKNMSGIQLSELTHQEQPWLRARGAVGPGANSTAEVSLADMLSYFTALGEQSRPF